MLEPVRSRCPFRQYIKPKRAKCCINIYALADSRTFLWRKNGGLPWKTTALNCPFPVRTADKDFLLRLVLYFSYSGRNERIDIFFCLIQFQIPMTILLPGFSLTSSMNDSDEINLENGDAMKNGIQKIVVSCPA